MLGTDLQFELYWIIMRRHEVQKKAAKNKAYWATKLTRVIIVRFLDMLDRCDTFYGIKKY